MGSNLSNDFRLDFFCYHQILQLKNDTQNKQLLKNVQLLLINIVKRRARWRIAVSWPGWLGTAGRRSFVVDLMIRSTGKAVFITECEASSETPRPPATCHMRWAENDWPVWAGVPSAHVRDALNTATSTL